jgi:aconitate hydratase
MTSLNSFGARGDLQVGSSTYEVFRLSALAERFPGVARLPYSLKVLLENLLRNEDDASVFAADIEALASWNGADTDTEISYTPARVLMQDFTGVPAVVDLASMRDAMAALGGDPQKVNPLVPVDLVIDHSVIVDNFATATAFDLNVSLEYQRNAERYRFLRWGQQAFENFRVVPPGTGICHQVNVEYLAQVVFTRNGQAYPDTCVGTDSHTPMVNGLGVVGWGVGGIEAEAAMLGQPIPMLIPRVVGFKLTGELPEGATATDLVLTVTELLRKHGVVGKFVEFYGPGCANVPVYNRATIGNMSPEYGSTITIFPIDDQTLEYLRATGRTEEQIALVEAYAKEQGLWLDPSVVPVFSEHVELDLSTVVPSLAGPARPQDRVPLTDAKSMFATAVVSQIPDNAAGGDDTATTDTRLLATPSDRPRRTVGVRMDDGSTFALDHGHVVIAAITSCTNTSNPEVMLAAGLVAKKAVEAGLQRQPWVKSSLAPGSKVVSDYYAKAGLQPYLDKLGFNLVGYGCTTCIGNSGPLPAEISAAVNEAGLAVVSVLSGNRNFEGRVNPDVRMNYLASPPLVVAYALAGTMDIDVYNEPLGEGTDGPVYLRDIWPTNAEIAALVQEAVGTEQFRKAYGGVFDGDARWQGLDVPEGEKYAWDGTSTYIRRAPYFDGMPATAPGVGDIRAARALAVLGDSVTTDHISPAGSIKASSPAGIWLQEQGVTPADFNQYGARRGNHEVMIRGTFANTRIRNRMAPGTEGGVTVALPGDDVVSIYDASLRYQDADTPLVVLAGKEYGSGSSRDWAAKGTALLGVKAVIAESYERIHRSNLIGMGVLPLQFEPGQSVASLGLTGRETFDIVGLDGLGDDAPMPRTLEVKATGEDGRVTDFIAVVRIDTPKEADYYRHGGVLPYMLRRLSAAD